MPLLKLKHCVVVAKDESRAHPEQLTQIGQADKFNKRLGNSHETVIFKCNVRKLEKNYYCKKQI